MPQCLGGGLIATAVAKFPRLEVEKGLAPSPASPRFPSSSLVTHVHGRSAGYSQQGITTPIRWTSSATLLEYPLVSIAIGPDPSKNELRGHARAIIAIGDIATGVIALGGVARGAIALGGLALGGVALGGCGIGLLALGGLALGYLAMGGLAVGYAAIGGLAVGYYAMGGAAFGKFVIAPLRQDPQAVEFFSRLWPGLPIPPGRKLR